MKLSTSYDVYCVLNKQWKSSTFQKIVSSSNVSLWIRTTQVKMKIFYKNRTWKLIQLSKSWKTIGCKWVYKIKQDENDKVRQYHTKLIIKTYTHKEDIDFNEILLSIVRLNSKLFW